MEQVQGLPGELVDRLIALLNCNDLGEGEWYNLSFFLVFFVGGRKFAGVLADTGIDPKPGTVGEEITHSSTVVSRERYFELIRDRLMELVASGIDESFLVQSLRDALRRELASFTDVSHGDRNRAEMRADIQQSAEDPEAIARFRDHLAAFDPSAATLSDEELAARLRGLSESVMLLPSAPDVILDRWAALTHWDQHAALILPESVFDYWLQQTAKRLRDPGGSAGQKKPSRRGSSNGVGHRG